MPDLRPYQQEDVNFLSTLQAAACFNEMRTGKTPTALKTFEQHGLTKILIICPASSILQWTEEYTRWLNKPCIGLLGTYTQKEKLLQKWTHGLVVSYDAFKPTQRSDGLLYPILDAAPEGIILDEAHRIKNPKSAAAKAAFLCLKIPRKLALTGTPAPNKPYEVWSILHWLYPKDFSSYWNFIEEYFTKIKRYNPRTGQTFIEIGNFKKGKQLALQNILASISTQRKRKEIMPWLPEKDYQKILLEPTKEQSKYLKELQEFFETEDVITQGILDRLIRERQICLHPRILNLKGKSPKLEWIKQYIQDYPDKPILIFSKFTSFINIMQQELKNSIGIIVGETPIEKRNELKNAFQSGKLNVLIMQIDTGKEALTLDRAEAIIFCDKYPPASDIQQAEDRFIATTEDKANKPHTIIELILKGTYDEKIYDLINQHISETDLINDYKKYLKGGS